MKTDRIESLLSMAEKISLENIFSGMEELCLHQKPNWDGLKIISSACACVTGATLVLRVVS